MSITVQSIQRSMSLSAPRNNVGPSPPTQAATAASRAFHTPRATAHGPQRPEAPHHEGVHMPPDGHLEAGGESLETWGPRSRGPSARGAHLRIRSEGSHVARRLSQGPDVHVEIQPRGESAVSEDAPTLLLGAQEADRRECTRDERCRETER